MSERCGACFKKIDGTYITALNEIWHPDCFVCEHCKKPFPNGKYLSYKGKAYCKTDYEYICQTCGKVIAEKFVTVGNDRYHTYCLKCQVCKKVIGSAFYSLNDKYLCKEDYDLELKAGPTYSKPASTSGDICSACAKPILYGNPIIAEGKKYHNYCLVCEACHNVISGSYEKYKGQILCTKCKDFICSKCGKVIDDDFVTLEGHKIHGQCLTCVYCDKRVDYRSFLKVKGKPCCQACFDSQK